jgi:hypothetical protein
MTSERSYVARDLGPGLKPELVARGHKERHVFPHRIVRLPKPGPDGYKLAQRMCGPVSLGELWELVLYALPPVLDEFPADVFFDDDIAWHQQQFGLPGQVATVNLVEQPPDVYAMVLISDVVQRIGRRRDLKTRIENRFAGWSRMLVHAVCEFALDHGLERVHVATADWALQNTDPGRSVQRSLFERVYDHSIGPPFTAARHEWWWVLDVRANASVVVRPEVRRLPLSNEPEICVCHDIERGWGHRDVDPRFAATAELAAPAHLDRMLEVEADAGVRATYSVVGALLPEIRPALAAGGHAIAFHSYDHQIASGDDRTNQLGRCREVDYRIKGYRPPQSRLTEELTEPNLAFHNFEWLASSQYSLSLDAPVLNDALVFVPILFDDFDLHRGTDYGDWEKPAVQRLASTRSAAFSLHDCYGDLWLPHYRRLLDRLGDLGRLRTVDEVAADVLLSQAE